MNAIKEADNRRRRVAAVKHRGARGQAENEYPPYPLRSITLLVALFALAIVSVSDGSLVSRVFASDAGPAKTRIVSGDDFQFPSRP